MLHAVGGATAERAAAAAAANKFAPLYVPSAELLAGVARFFGLAPSFPLHRLLARSMGALSLVLVAEEGHPMASWGASEAITGTVQVLDVATRRSDNFGNCFVLMQVNQTTNRWHPCVPNSWREI